MYFFIGLVKSKSFMNTSDTANHHKQKTACVYNTEKCVFITFHLKANPIHFDYSQQKRKTGHSFSVLSCTELLAMIDKTYLGITFSNWRFQKV